MRSRQPLWSRLGLLALFLGPAVAPARPYLPDNDEVVLERSRLPDGTERRRLRALRASLARDPGDLALATTLARRYLALGRREADPRYYGYAQATLAPWWGLAAPPAEVLLLRATLRQRRHALAAALRDLELVLQGDGSLEARAQAWLARATILRVQGDYPEAYRSCLPLWRLVPGLVAATCTAHVKSLSGEAASSDIDLRHALESRPRAPPAHRMWALTVLAEIAARRGRWEEAERHFLAGLELDPRDSYLTGAYADLLLDRGRPDEALILLRERRGPDTLLVRLALAEDALGLPGLERDVRELTARFEAARLGGRPLHLRDQARFALHLAGEPALALDLALRNWSGQREPWDARIVLEAALAAGDPEGARDVRDWIGERGLEDARIDPLLERLEGSLP